METVYNRTPVDAGVRDRKSKWHRRLFCPMVRDVCLEMSLDPQSVGPWGETQYIVTHFAVNTPEEELAPVTGWLSSRTLAAPRVSDENQFET